MPGQTRSRRACRHSAAAAEPLLAAAVGHPCWLCCSRMLAAAAEGGLRAGQASPRGHACPVGGAAVEAAVAVEVAVAAAAAVAVAAESNEYL